MAHPRGEIATALTCYLQGFCQLMLIAAKRLYDNSTTAASSRVAKRTPGMCPGGFARQALRSILEGCFPAIQAAWSRPGNPLGCQLSQARQRVSRGVADGRRKQRAAAGTHGPPHPLPVQVCRWEKDCLSSGYRDGLQVWRWSVY